MQNPTERRAISRVREMFHHFLDFVRFGHKPDSPEDLEQEIQELLDEGKEQGLITDQEGRMINSIFDFRDTEVREIMTPASDIVSAPADTPLADFIRLVIDQGYSRIPVYAGTPDNITGIVHAKDLLPWCLSCSRPPPALASCSKPAIFVPEDKQILALLLDFQTRKNHMAIVTDEFGGVRGLVTLEDVLEVIVGEIADEYDTDTREIRVLDPVTILVPAKIDIEKIENHLAVLFPEGPYESVGGVILHRLGRVPATGEIVLLNGLEMKVLAATSRRIKFVRIRKTGGSPGRIP